MYAIDGWWKENEVLLRWKSNQVVVRWIRDESLLRNAYVLFLGQVMAFLLALGNFFSSSIVALGNFLFFKFSVFQFYFIFFEGLLNPFCRVHHHGCGIVGDFFVLGVCRCGCAPHS